jgi:hypothetical protein
MNAHHDQVSDAWRAHRAYLVDLAFRMLGDMAVQDLVPERMRSGVRAPRTMIKRLTLEQSAERRHLGINSRPRRHHRRRVPARSAACSLMATA